MGIHEVIIEVGDVADAVEFYRKVAGFRHVRTVEQDGRSVAEMDAAGQRVTLVASGGPGVRLALRSHDVKAERRRLRRHKADVAEETQEAPGGQWLAFTDPWGNRLGFWQPADD